MKIPDLKEMQELSNLGKIKYEDRLFEEVLKKMESVAGNGHREVSSWGKLPQRHIKALEEKGYKYYTDTIMGEAFTISW